MSTEEGAVAGSPAEMDVYSCHTSWCLQGEASLLSQVFHLSYPLLTDPHPTLLPEHSLRVRHFLEHSMTSYWSGYSCRPLSLFCRPQHHFPNPSGPQFSSKYLLLRGALGFSLSTSLSVAFWALRIWLGSWAQPGEGSGDPGPAGPHFPT